MRFYKGHSFGNNFIILEDFSAALTKITKDLIVKLCDPKVGIGADGVMIASPSNQATIKMKIFNSDGSEAAMCGNGARLFAKYAFEKKLVNSNFFVIETKAGLVEVALETRKEKVLTTVVNIGQPSWSINNFPASKRVKRGSLIDYRLKLQGSSWLVTGIVIGVPHVVVFTSPLDERLMRQVGYAIEHHRSFSQGVNVDFVTVEQKNKISIVTWERGVGLTSSCGTGAAAAVVAGNLTDRTTKTVEVKFKLGKVKVTWGDDNNLILEGEAAEDIAEGEFLG